MKALEAVGKDLDKKMNDKRRMLEEMPKPEDFDLGSFNKTLKHFAELEKTKTMKEAYDYMMKNPDMYAELNK